MAVKRNWYSFSDCVFYLYGSSEDSAAVDICRTDICWFAYELTCHLSSL